MCRKHVMNYYLFQIWSCKILLFTCCHTFCPQYINIKLQMGKQVPRLHMMRSYWSWLSILPSAGFFHFCKINIAVMILCTFRMGPMWNRLWTLDEGHSQPFIIRRCSYPNASVSNNWKKVHFMCHATGSSGLGIQALLCDRHRLSSAVRQYVAFHTACSVPD